MNLAAISIAYLRARPLANALNLFLLALGIATITLLMLATAQIESRMLRDARGIDLVAGAKGSPMQLVLSAVFHVDVPAGNIPLKDATALARNPAVKKAIPLALGDSFKGYRIVGSNHDYVAHYGARIAEGRLWTAPMEAVLGAELPWDLLAVGGGLSLVGTLAGLPALPFALGENGLQMQRHVLRRGLEQLRHLRLRHPHCVRLKPALDTRPPVLRLVKDEFGLGWRRITHAGLTAR